MNNHSLGVAQTNQKDALEGALRLPAVPRINPLVWGDRGHIIKGLGELLGIWDSNSLPERMSFTISCTGAVRFLYPSLICVTNALH